MIIKKKILSNEIIRRKLKQIRSKDKHLFKNDHVRFIGNSYIYNLKNTTISSDGRLITTSNGIINDYLGFSSISKKVALKKIVLKSIYYLNIFIKKIFFKSIFVNMNCVVIYNRNSNGFFHWLTDTLPKITIARKINKKFTLVLPSKLNLKFINQSLNEYNIKFFFMKENKNYHFKKITYIGELYPSGSPRKKVLENLKKQIKTKPSKFNRVYISRNKSNRRKISNEIELIKVLMKYKFKIVYAEKLSFLSQVNLFSSAKFLIGLHGAGISNILWMKKNTNLLELKPEKDLYLNCYYNIANLLNINYNYLVCKKNNYFKSSKNSDYFVNIDSLNKKLKKILNEKKSN